MLSSASLWMLVGMHLDKTLRNYDTADTIPVGDWLPLVSWLLVAIGSVYTLLSVRHADLVDPQSTASCGAIVSGPATSRSQR